MRAAGFEYFVHLLYLAWSILAYLGVRIFLPAKCNREVYLSSKTVDPGGLKRRKMRMGISGDLSTTIQHQREMVQPLQEQIV